LRSHESRSRTCRNSIICTSIVIKTIRVIYRSLDRYGYATTLEPNGRLGATPTFKHPNPATCLKARQGKPNEESSHVCWRGSVTARRDLAIDRVRAGLQSRPQYQARRSHHVRQRASEAGQPECAVRPRADSKSAQLCHPERHHHRQSSHAVDLTYCKRHSYHADRRLSRPPRRAGREQLWDL